MTVTNLTILNQTVHGQASGNYDGSSLDFDSDAVKAVGYYRGQGSVQTVYLRLQGFVGVIHLDCTLNEDPNSVDSTFSWFETAEYGDDTVPITTVHPITLTGNFTWIRARVVDFTAGTIESITISY